MVQQEKRFYRLGDFSMEVMASYIVGEKIECSVQKFLDDLTPFLRQYLDVIVIYLIAIKGTKAQRESLIGAVD